MANNLRRAIQDLNLGIDDAPVPIPSTVCHEAIRANRFSLIGRALVPRHQNLREIVSTLPRNWGLSGSIAGRVIERRMFQFVFPSEDLMQSVLNRGPWAFGDRMLVLKRWTPEMDEFYLNSISFWVQIRGIPLIFLTRNVINHIASTLGDVEVVDFNPEAAAAVEFVRVKVTWNVDNPLRFQRNFQFTPGVNTVIKFKYERLRGFCEVCGLLTPDTGACVVVEDVPEAGDDDNNDNNDDGNNGEDGDHHVHIPDPFIQHLNQQPRQGDYNQEDEVHEPVGEEGMNEDVENMRASDFHMTPSELIQPVTSEAHALRKRRFMAALVSDLIRDEEAGRQESPRTPRSGEPSSAEEQEDPYIPQWVTPADDESSFQQYGSFMNYNVLQDIQDEPSMKKARLSGEYDNGESSASRSNEEVSNSLSKLQADYTGSDISSPDQTPQDRGAVGPVPPPVP
ncbi:unnamed protein product [Microthlaspi erraticum]|uniref:DUF4283 domain-containing protein n=1 Tax=Microthlaspi erraticum TaxID=1685480 RepID=A0A6D2HXI3_9BRAS|nr:unnamed protein product [Microthlaspi erraticum]